MLTEYSLSNKERSRLDGSAQSGLVSGEGESALNADLTAKEAYKVWN